MQGLPGDITRKTALNLSPRDIISLCLTNKKFTGEICNSNDFWAAKIMIDYPRQTYLPQYYRKFSKNLYMHLTMNSKIVEIDYPPKPGPADFDGDAFGDDEDYEKELRMITDGMTKYINNNKDFIYRNFLKRGDVLHTSWKKEYRNNHKYLWDGTKVVPLDYKIDEYGSVPREFSFPEFRPDYFSESISHNNIVRLTSDKIYEVINNFDPETQTSYITDKYNKYIVRINYDIQDLNIKFSKIVMRNNFHLDYDTNGKMLVLNMDTLGNYGQGGSSHSVQHIQFYPEWKDAIISIEPGQNTIYKWDGNVLIVTTYGKKMF